MRWIDDVKRALIERGISMEQGRIIVRYYDNAKS